MGDSSYNNTFFTVLLILSLLLLFTTNSESTVFNVLDYGAVGNGLTDDTNAFANAWKATCASSSSSSPMMHVPSGKTFFVQPLEFDGPCESDTIIVEIEGNFVAPSDPSSWDCGKNDCENWISFRRVDGLRVSGHGSFDGRGQKWWDGKHEMRPNTLEIASSDDVRLGDGLRFKDSPRVHLVLNSLRNAYVSHVSIEAPESSPNTDGIRVSSCTNVHIDHTRIGTGDDCIAMIGGSSYVTISNITCGPGHGISIGSLGKNGGYDTAEHVRVGDVVFIGATNGARIKTWQGGKGYVRDILFERLLFHNTGNPIIIDQFYCDHAHCTTSESAIEIRNVTYRQILGTSRKKKVAVKLDCSETVPCRDIVFEDIHIIGIDGKIADYECRNVYGRSLGDKVPRLSCLY
ncbi:hypothetical protein ABFX02_09G033800 [Erythranthe guttata]